MKILFFLLLFLEINISIYSFELNNNTYISLTKPQVLLNGILHSTFVNKETIFFSYVSSSKAIITGVLQKDNDNFTFKELETSFRYEEQDVLIFVDIFYYKGITYLTHLEKFSFEFLLTYNKNKIKIGDTEKRPYVFLDGNILKCFFLDKNINSLVYKEINLDTLKTKEIIGEANIDSFFVSYCPQSKNTAIIWQIKNYPKEFFLSSMDKDFNGYNPITLLKFDEKIDMPQININDKNIVLAFLNDYQNKYLFYPFTEDVRNFIPENFSEEFKDYKITKMFYLDNIYVAVLKKTIENINKQKVDEVEIIISDYNLKYSLSLKIPTIEGVTSNFKFIQYKDVLLVFWIEKVNNNNLIKYSTINFIPKSF
ncbi:MAG: hypothetical protein A2086_06665 [Spirochaetes bacterium GWD1_27_9]|nr:MAG: hypothetical protein A2Z98_00520 [Spirochaetes bacterium GWB1_27_13]OHD20051.1 MAG: hypothetical protein A2Y34_08075 [Spirochaetes bacterium GWC1_27_15]OHD41321.1 MAG: hypothetical protein A2086_06665 [Spirochaetes bacterium GWD1_27_9]